MALRRPQAVEEEEERRRAAFLKSGTGGSATGGVKPGMSFSFRLASCTGRGVSVPSVFAVLHYIFISKLIKVVYGLMAQ